MPIARRLFLLASIVQLVTSLAATAGPSVAAGRNHVLLLTTDGYVWGWGSNGVAVQRTPALVPIANVISVAAGENASYALKTDGTLWAWGYNGLGQLGTGDTISSATPVFVTGGVIAVAAGQQHVSVLKT